MIGLLMNGLTLSHGLYVFQVIAFASLVITFTQRQLPIARYPTLLWAGGSIALVQRYGVEGQLVFYSNDQVYYTSVVADVLSSGVPLDVDWLLSASRLPFTLPAIVLALIGLPPVLALKCVSLGYLIALFHFITKLTRVRNFRDNIVTFYLCGVGVIGIFFSLLAQRETSMMYFTALLFFAASPSVRITAALLLFLLRPHLAVAILVALLIVSVATRRSSYNLWSPLSGAMALTLGSITGYFVYIAGLWYQYGIGNAPGHYWGIQPVLRIFSNFLGLQFLTVSGESVEFSLRTLLLGRLVFSETVVIPVVLLVTALTSRALDRTGKWILWSFAIYVGLVTNTEFNSFRQNIPFIPAIGLMIVANARWLSFHQGERAHPARDESERDSKREIDSIRPNQRVDTWL